MLEHALSSLVRILRMQDEEGDEKGDRPHVITAVRSKVAAQNGSISIDSGALSSGHLSVHR